MNELRRILVSQHNNENYLINWTLVKPAQLITSNLGGIVAGSFHSSEEFINLNDNFNDRYRTVAKNWRKLGITRTHRVENFSQQLTGTSDYSLANITKQLKAIPMMPKHTETLWKIMSGGLYVGERANDYLINTKKIKPGKPLVPAECIYYNYEYTPDYQPRHPKPQGRKTANLQHIMWESEIAKLIWDVIFQLLNKLGFTGFENQYNNWNCVYTVIDQFNTDGGISEVIKINLLVIAIYQIYTIYKELQDRFTNKHDPDKPQLNDAYIDYIRDDAIKQLNKKIRQLIYLTPIFNFLLKKRINKNARRREMMPLPYTKFHELTKQEMELLSGVWKDIIHYDTNQLRIKPLKWEISVTHPP